MIGLPARTILRVQGYQVSLEVDGNITQTENRC